MSTLKDLAMLGYAAFIASLVAPGSGAPSCFSPLTWAQLMPSVQEAYLASAQILEGFGPPAPHDERVIARLAHRAHLTKLRSPYPGPNTPWEKLDACHQQAWVAFARAVI